jgi:phage FluMu gp28-like protein
MTKYQTAMINCEERFACIESSTKAGKTFAMIVWLFEQALNCKANQAVTWLAPVYSQAAIAFNRLRNQINERRFFRVNESRLELTLPNGAIINFKSADSPDNLYGNDCYAAVLDEASRMSEAAWIAIRSTLTATNGPAKIISNVKGRKNFAYKLAMKAKAGEPGYFYKRVTCWDAVDAGILKLEEIEAAQRDLPESVFQELYMAEASEDSGNPFGIDHIRRCVFPLSKNRTVCYGIDLAKKNDWTVITGLDQFGNVSYFERFQTDWKQCVERIIALPAGLITIDSTGIGDAVAEQIARVRDTEMFVFTQRSKQQLMEGLAFAIQNRNVTILEGIMRDELDSFEYVYTENGVRYSGPSGMHDDCVCSLALAVKNLDAFKLQGEFGIW